MIKHQAKYIENYYNAWGFGEQSIVLCEHPEGSEKADDIHHIEYRSHGGSDDFDNLIALCRKHHDEAHREGSGSEKVKKWKRYPNDH